MFHKCSRDWVKQQRQRILGRVFILIPNFTPPAWEPFLAELMRRQVRIKTSQSHLNEPYLRLQQIIENVPVSRACDPMDHTFGPSSDERRQSAFSLHANVRYASAMSDMDQARFCDDIVQGSAVSHGIPVMYHGFDQSPWIWARFENGCVQLLRKQATGPATCH